MPTIDEKSLEQFKIVINNMPDEDFKVVYNAMESSVDGEYQNINGYTTEFGGYAIPSTRRNDNLFQILKKYGLCDFEYTSPTGLYSNFRWTGPLANINSPNNGQNFPSGSPGSVSSSSSSFKLPRKCTNVIAVRGTLSEWNELEEKNDEELNNGIKNGTVWYANGQTRIPISTGPFPTQYTSVDSILPITVDWEKWVDNLTNVSSATPVIRIPYKIWTPPNDSNKAFEESKIPEDITPEELAEGIAILEVKIIREAEHPIDSNKPDVALYKAKQKLVKLGILISGREVFAFWQLVKTTQFGKTAGEIKDLMTAARLKGQKFVYYGPEWTQYKVDTKYGIGTGILTSYLIIDGIGFSTAISEGHYDKAAEKFFSITRTVVNERLKLGVKHAAEDAAIAVARRTVPIGPLTQATETAIALEAGTAGNVVVWSSMIPEIILLLALYGYNTNEEAFIYDFLYNQALKNKWEPHIYADTRGRVIIQGSFNTEKAIKTPSGQIITMPLEYPKSNGGSFSSEYFKFGQDPLRVFSGVPQTEGERQQQLNFQSRFGTLIQMGLPINTLIKQHPRMVVPIEVIVPKASPIVTPEEEFRLINGVIQNPPFPNNAIPSLIISSPEPPSLVGNVFGAIGKIPFNPPKRTDDYESEANGLGATIDDVDTTYGNPEIGYDTMDSMIDTAFESIPAKHRTYQWGNTLYSCLSLATQMVVNNLSNIPPVDLNMYPKKETDLIGGDNMSKFIPDLAMVGGHTAPYSEGSFNPTPPSQNSCFPWYVKVLTPNGDKKISEIKVGDLVMSFDGKNGEILPKLVTHKFIHDGQEKTDVYRYKLSNGINLDITENHSVFTEDGVFIQIGKMNIGDKLVDVNNDLLSIVSKEFLFNSVVYNIEVEDFHTYFAENIKVHNALKFTPEYILDNRNTFIITGGSPETRTDDAGRAAKYFAGRVTTSAQQGRISNPQTVVTTSEISYCFPSFSKIYTPKGYKKISNIKLGDVIFSYNIDGKLEESIVIEKINHYDDIQDVYQYSFSDGSVLCVTDGHEILKSDGQFLPVNEIKIGEFVKNVFNEDVELLRKEYFNKIPVHSIFPEKNNTYIVDGIRVNSGILIEMHK